MIRHIWSVICKESIINQDNNALSLMNIFEGFEIVMKKDVPKNPEIIIPVEYEIVSMLRKDSKNEEKGVYLKASLFDPSGKEIIKSIEASITMPKDKFNFRHRIKSFGFKITTQGEYKVVIELKQGEKQNFEKVAELSINITIK